VTSEQKKWAWAVAAGIVFLAGIVVLVANSPPPTVAEERQQQRDFQIVRDRMLGATPVVIEPSSGSAGPK
jgi:hypothetical protein